MMPVNGTVGTNLNTEKTAVIGTIMKRHATIFSGANVTVTIVKHLMMMTMMTMIAERNATTTMGSSSEIMDPVTIPTFELVL